MYNIFKTQKFVEKKNKSLQIPQCRDNDYFLLQSIFICFNIISIIFNMEKTYLYQISSNQFADYKEDNK